jgi:hypothetical protein
MEWQKVNREIAATTYDSLSKMFSADGSVPDKGLRFVIEENKKIAKVNREIAFNEVADFTMLKEAQNELAMKGR